jgi:hypothetical protein
MGRVLHAVHFNRVEAVLHVRKAWHAGCISRQNTAVIERAA